MTRKTVVLVCMVDSVHVARWIAQFDPTEVKFILFPSGPNRRVHPKIVEMMERGKQFDNQMTLVPFGGKLSLPLWALDRFFSDRIRGLLLRRTLKKIQPHFVHALEFQHAGYVTIRALEDQSVKTPFIATNYGSDIYWFQRFPDHKAKIKKILDRANRYSAECQRDYLLAKSLGFDGLDLPLVPNAGGIEPNGRELPTIRASDRKTITIKGYHGWVGRALVAIEAVGLIQKELQEFEIVVYSANTRVARAASRLRRTTGMNLRVHKKGFLSHEEVLEIFKRSRVYVGVSLSDGISTSLLEAMAKGAFPIQTKTSCASEWIVHKVSGILIDKVDARDVADAIKWALVDEIRVDRAQMINVKTIQTRANYRQIVEESKSFYSAQAI